MKIFFDLDGTLLDSRQRLYRLFQYLVPSSILTFEEYWNFKRNKVGHQEILSKEFSYSNKQIQAFEKEWMEKIEMSEWIAYDKPFEGVTDYLVNLSHAHSLYLITSRQFEDVVLSQIAFFGWKGLFEAVLVTGQIKEKEQLVRTTVRTESTDWFVGDTGIDIETGKKLGMKTVAVLSGFLSREKLIRYEPDMIVESVVQFKI